MVVTIKVPVCECVCIFKHVCTHSGGETMISCLSRWCLHVCMYWNKYIHTKESSVGGGQCFFDYQSSYVYIQTIYIYIYIVYTEWRELIGARQWFDIPGRFWAVLCMSVYVLIYIYIYIYIYMYIMYIYIYLCICTSHYLKNTMEVKGLFVYLCMYMSYV